MGIFNIENVIKLIETEAGDVCAILETRRDGLKSEEAAQRLSEYGRNRLPREKAESLVKKFVRQLTHFMAILLWVAGILAFVAQMPQLGWASWAVILINALFSFLQEFRAEKALSSLEDMLPKKVRIYRDGRLETMLAEEVTIGDVMFLSAGDHVPADARIIEANGLFVDTSMLTGESVPVDRDATAVLEFEEDITQSPNLLFAGTLITDGNATAVAYAVGKSTQIGMVSSLTVSVKRGKSTLEYQVERIVKFITGIAIVMGIVTFLLTVLLVGIDLRYGFIFAIGIIVANIPEGLLPTVSLSLAIGVQRMARQNALVRRLSAVETLSATSVICTDKTGTITENQLTVEKIWFSDLMADVTGVGYEKEGEVVFDENEAAARQLELLLTASVVCSEATIEDDSENLKTWQISGDPTEAALLIAAAKRGLDIDKTRSDFERRLDIPFNSVTKMMSVVVENNSSHLFPEGRHITFTKGAPLEVLKSCSHILKEGAAVELEEADRRAVAASNDDLANMGYRVLALAYNDSDHVSELPEAGLAFIGLVAMLDPPRPEVARAISQCHHAGIGITMITGDYGLTGAAIGRQVGLFGNHVEIITGSEVDELDHDGLCKVLSKKEPVIFARANPEHKLRIVEAYKSIGHVVAVTGDGVNDAPALKSAHIGIAMGKSGTDVAREAADIVLLDDNFATIVKAIEQGRAIYDNIKKFMTYILASNIPEFVPFMAMVFLKIPPALNILQILAVDLGTDIVPALALGAEKPEKHILRKPPRSIDENLLDMPLFARAYGFLGVIEAALSLGAFLLVWFHAGYTFSDLQGVTDDILFSKASPEVMQLYWHSTTMALLAIVACQIGNIFVCRSERLPFWKLSIKSNYMILAGIAYETILSALIVYLPFLAAVFMTAPISLFDLGVLALCPLILVTLEETRKYIMNGFWKKRT